MRIPATLLLLLWCVFAHAATVTYNTNTMVITSTNLLGSNVLAGTNITVSKGDQGRLTVGLNSVTPTQLGYLVNVTNDIQSQLWDRITHPRFRRWGMVMTRQNSVTFQIMGESATATGTPTAAAAPDANDGVMENIATGALNQDDCGITGDLYWRVGRNVWFSAAVMTVEAGAKITWIGLTDQTLATQVDSDNPAGNYAMFRASTVAGDTVWKAITKDNATQTITATGVATNSSTKIFEIIDNGASWLFKIDGVNVATNSANLPTAGTNLRYVIGEETQEALAKNIRIGWVFTTIQK